MSGATKGAKNFQLTINAIDTFDDVLTYVRSLSPNYLIACKEKAPTTGHVHYHVYIQFSNSRRLSLKKLKGAHVEKCRGSPKQNVDYIKKDGEIIVEEGAPRLGCIPTIKQLKEMTPQEREGINSNMYNIVAKINNEENKYVKVEDYYKEIKVWYIWGESGVGKTKWAIKDMKERNISLFNEVKFDGSFWHGVTEDCEVALYDDWRDSQMKPAEFINFIDYNRHVFNVKGGSKRNNYKLIYITSVQPLDEIFRNVSGEPRKQWERRMNVVHIGPKVR